MCAAMAATSSGGPLRAFRCSHKTRWRNGRRWLLAARLPPPAPDVAPARAWSASARSGERARRYAIAALRRSVERVVAAPEGARNDTLNRETFGLARLIADDAL